MSDVWNESSKPQRRAVTVPRRVLTSRGFRWLGPRIFPPAHRFVHRATRGRTILDSSAQPMLMLASTGARTGKQRETPLATVPRGNGAFLVVGSNFGRANHPSWTANLLAEPAARITYRGSTMAVTARLLTDEERGTCWTEMLAWYPAWAGYTELTDRELRVFELTPTDASTRAANGGVDRGPHGPSR
ncbi:MAG: nitroreductase family deazaflavin-dependent oxidoreductase [Acidimicrobiales bacterium]|jgi:deazaflavin-dependent oxidoreductase (nitroreductase family)|nr:nitroreductase family deazaflavin-dependent oxidoreductase [Acidimicrobiales bacterium]